MARLVITIHAAAITAMLADNAGPDVAARYRREIDALYDRLIMFPRSGAPRPSWGRYARLAVVEPYVVIYDHRPDVVTVLRILDGRRNITRRLVRQ
ncbi:MAG TPA: type II toxin-antitoxin system RelE/ParE family toxin [Reyranella sp.]|nr:type II toxin-antitoxin system RelE/ParE family toxin [Reyranella sp.]